MSATNESNVNARFKKQANAIKERLSALGVEIKVGHAYEAQAIALGFPNWATLSAAKNQPAVRAIGSGEVKGYPIHEVEASIKELFAAYDFAGGSKTDFLHLVSGRINEVIDRERNPLRLLERAMDSYELPAIGPGRSLSFNEQLRTASRLLYVRLMHRLIGHLLSDLADCDVVGLLKQYAVVEVEADSEFAPTARMRRLDREKHYESVDPSIAGLTDVAKRYAEEYPGLIREFIENLEWFVGEVSKSDSCAGVEEIWNLSLDQKSIVTKLLILLEVSPDFVEKVVRKAIRP